MTPLFIDDFSDPDIETFLENDSQLAYSRATFVFAIPGTIAVSFVGPTSGNLILRLTYRSTEDSTNLTITGTSFQLSLSSSLTVDDITLHANHSESDKPSFEPGIRNSLIIQVPMWPSSIYDIRLLDQRENCYGAASQSPEVVSIARCVLLSIDRSIAAVDLIAVVHQVQLKHQSRPPRSPNTSPWILQSKRFLDAMLPAHCHRPVSTQPQGHEAGTSRSLVSMSDVLKEDNDGLQIVAHRS